MLPRNEQNIIFYILNQVIPSTYKCISTYKEKRRNRHMIIPLIHDCESFVKNSVLLSSITRDKAPAKKMTDCTWICSGTMLNNSISNSVSPLFCTLLGLLAIYLPFVIPGWSICFFYLSNLALSEKDQRRMRGIEQQ